MSAVTVCSLSHKPKCLYETHFTTWCHSSVVDAVVMCSSMWVSILIWLINSLSLSLLLKWISIRLCKQCCTMMQELRFSYAKGFGKIQMESSLAGVQNATFWAVIYQVIVALAGWCCVGCQVSLLSQQMSVFIVWTLTAICQPFNVGLVSQILVLLKWNKKVCEGYKKRTNWVKKRKELWVSWIWLEYSW